MTRVIVVGAGIGGLSAALAMQAKGFDVRVLERDPPPPSPRATADASQWRRRGAPQVPHPHFLMGGLRNLIYAHHPNLVDALLRAGVWELPFEATLHPAARSNYRAEPGDAQLTAFVSRRATLEITIRRYVDALPGVEVISNCDARQLCFDADAQRKALTVTGVQVLRDHAATDELTGDVVIDASGRSGRFDRQLREAGADIRDEHHESGDVYFTRQYRLLPGQRYAPLHGLPAIITSDYTIGMLPADNGYFTITIAVWKDDPVLYEAVKDPRNFEAFCRLIPRAAGWIDPNFAAPVNDIVYGFGGLDSFWRTTVVDGAPQVHGLFFLGDTAVRTNPKYGRGCTWGFTQAHLLADILAREGDPARRAIEYEAALQRAFRANWTTTLSMDRDRYRQYQAKLLGQPLSLRDRISEKLDEVIIQRGMRADAHLHRAIMTGYHGLAGLADWARNPAVWARASRILLSPATKALPDPIPPRERVVATLGGDA
jgi:2-polyprenyl-6-methoxyphenol hydroxylase-like FAD-dependent oxidoreductase